MHESRGVEIADLRSNLRWKIRSVEAGNSIHRDRAVEQRAPKRLLAGAERSDDADAGDRNSCAIGHAASARRLKHASVRDAMPSIKYFVTMRSSTNRRAIGKAKTTSWTIDTRVVPFIGSNRHSTFMPFVHPEV